MTVMDCALAILADDVEARAFRDLFSAAPEPLAQALGLEIADVEDTTLLIARNIPDTMFNRAIGLGLHAPATPSRIDAIAAKYRDAGVRDWWLHVNPAASPAALGAWVEARGYTAPRRRSWAKMLRPASAAPRFDTDVTIRDVGPSEAADVAAAIAHAFGMPPPMSVWIGALAGRPGWRVVGAFTDRAIGGACVHLQGENAWLGIGGVRSDARGRGAHRALMAARIQAAIDAGCRWIVTETGEPIGEEHNPSLANMVRCGFERACSRANYAAPQPATS